MLDSTKPKAVMESVDAEPCSSRCQDIDEPRLRGHRLAQARGGRLRKRGGEGQCLADDLSTIGDL